MAQKLSPEVKTYIVQRLACFDTPAVVAKAVKEDFGLVITRQLVESNDPTKKAGATMAKKWVTLFEKARAQFLTEMREIAISHKPVRLRALQRMAQTAEEKGNFVLAASLLEQAAKEMGEAYTNRRQLEHTSPDGSMTPKEPAPASPPDSKLVDVLLERLVG